MAVADDGLVGFQTLTLGVVQVLQVYLFTDRIEKDINSAVVLTDKGESGTILYDFPVIRCHLYGENGRTLAVVDVLQDIQWQVFYHFLCQSVPLQNAKWHLVF